MKNMYFRRFLAYVIDIIFVGALTSVISLIPFVSPNEEAYNQAADQLVELVNHYEEKDEKTFQDEYIAISYDLNRANINYIVLNVVVIIAYFGIFQWQRNGQTFGKRIMKIRVVPAGENKLSFLSYFVRTVVLHNVIITILQVLVLLFMTKENYYLYYQNINLVGYVFMMILLLCMFIRNDRRGLHDLIARTNVVMEDAPLEDAVIVKPEEKKPKKTSSKEEKVTKAKTISKKSTKPKN